MQPVPELLDFRPQGRGSNKQLGPGEIPESSLDELPTGVVGGSTRSMDLPNADSAPGDGDDQVRSTEDTDN